MGRDELLAGARLTQQQHGRIGGRHLPGLFQHAAHGRTLSDDDTGALRPVALPAHVQVMVLFLVVANTQSPRLSGGGRVVELFPAGERVKAF